MQQMFQCPKCGSQNAIGQQFCGACGERFQYNCPHCGGIVEPTFMTCPNCGATLYWPTQQPRPLPMGGRAAYQEQGRIYQQGKSERKKTSPWLIGCLGLIAVVLLVGGIIFAIGRASQETPSTSPPSISTATIEITDVTTVSKEFGGGVYFLGFVKNVSTSRVGDVTLTLNMYDKAGVVIAQGDTRLLTELQPGERCPFRINPEPQPVESWDRYEITFETHSFSILARRLCPELKVISDQWEEGLIRGTLENTSENTAENVYICAAGYDNEGRLVAVGLQGGAGITIPAGVVAAFKVPYWFGETSKVTNYELFVKCLLKD